MIVSFHDKATEDVFDGRSTRQAREACPQALWSVAARRLDQLDSVITLTELNVPPGNRLEALGGDRDGPYSIRINQKFRNCFRWTELGPEDVEITDYH